MRDRRQRPRVNSRYSRGDRRQRGIEHKQRSTRDIVSKETKKKKKIRERKDERSRFPSSDRATEFLPSQPRVDGAKGAPIAEDI